MSVSRLPPAVALLRPHQYTKNLLVFAAPGAAGLLNNQRVLGETIAAFVLFCAVSSVGYVANDLADVEADRHHPRKRGRPIASGAVTPRQARITGIGLGVVAALTAPLLGWAFAAVLAGYAIVSLLYSNHLKRWPWVELGAVSLGFVLRAVGGGTASETPLSSWFLVVVSGGALLLIAGKRLGEILTIGDDTGSRAVLRHYSVPALRAFAAAAALLAVTAYSAWAASEATNRVDDDLGSWLLRLTAVPFGVAIGRFLMLSWSGRGEAPDILAVTDPVVIAAGAAWIALYAIGLYA